MGSSLGQEEANIVGGGGDGASRPALAILSTPSPLRFVLRTRPGRGSIP